MSYKDDERRRRLYQQREELSDEGKRMWDKMMEGFEDDDYDKPMAMGVGNILKKQKSIVREVIKEVIVETDETQRLRLELTKMMQVSRIVIKSCEIDMVHYTEKEEYFKANECKTAILCHTNLIERLQRILDGGLAYDTPTVLMTVNNQGSNLNVK